MFQIKKLNKIASVGTDRFLPDLFVCNEDCEDPDGILVRSASMHEYAFQPQLKAIARAGAGTNNIPIDRCTQEGIVVFNAPGANANAVKELVIASMLMASRDLVGGIEWVKSIQHEEGLGKLVEKGKSQFVGPEISGKKLGIIGLGAIGILVANVAIDLGMEVYGYDPYLTVDAALRLSKYVHKVNDVSELYAVSDYITIHVPFMKETEHTICSEAIAQMKDGVRILNLARGELVDDDAIAPALESGKVAKYVTDFPNEKVLSMKNVICLPHIGASTPESEENCAVMAVDELQDYLLNGNIRNSVNLPTVFCERSTGVRICVMHKNVPTMLGQITALIGDEKLNIDHITSKFKGDNAYTIIDLTENPEAAQLTDKIRHLSGIIRVREIR